MSWDPQYRLPPQIGRPVPPRRVGVPARPVASAARGRHNYSTGQARLALACLVAVIVFCVVCFHIHSSPAPEPSSGGSVSGPMQYGSHDPALGAAAIVAEARGAGHVARFAGRMAFRGGVLRGIGRGFGGGSYTPGGFGFHGFGGFGF